MDHHAATDASGQFGCGGLWKNRWFQVEWSAEYRLTKDRPHHNSIMLRELLPVVIAGATVEELGRRDSVR